MTLGDIKVVPFTKGFRGLVKVCQRAREGLVNTGGGRVGHLGKVSGRFFHAFGVSSSQRVVGLLLPLCVRQISSRFFSRRLGGISYFSGRGMRTCVSSLCDRALLHSCGRMRIFLSDIPAGNIKSLYSSTLCGLSVNFCCVRMAGITQLRRLLSGGGVRCCSGCVGTCVSVRGSRLLPFSTGHAPEFSCKGIVNTAPSRKLCCAPFTALSNLVDEGHLFAKSRSFMVPAHFTGLVRDGSFNDF